MNKSEFIDKVAEKAELTRAAAARAVEAIFDTANGAISEAVHAAGGFALPGFGKFTRKTRPARAGRNPRTGASITVPERVGVSFTAGKGLKTGTSTSRRRAAADGAAAPARKSAARKAAGGAATARKAAATKTAATKSPAAKKTAAKKSAPAKTTAKKTAAR